MLSSTTAFSDLIISSALFVLFWLHQYTNTPIQTAPKSPSNLNQISLLEYCTYSRYTFYNQKHANKFNRFSGSANCPLCRAAHSKDNLILGCVHCTVHGMIMNRHHTAVSLCSKAISKRHDGCLHYNASITMDACSSDKP